MRQQLHGHDRLHEAAGSFFLRGGEGRHLVERGENDGALAQVAIAGGPAQVLHEPARLDGALQVTEHVARLRLVEIVRFLAEDPHRRRLRTDAVAQADDDPDDGGIDGVCRRIIGELLEVGVVVVRHGDFLARA